MQEFWRILDFNWGDASQYPDVTLDTPNGSSDSLGTSAAPVPEEPEPEGSVPEPEGSVGDEISSLAVDLANAFKNVDAKPVDSSVSGSDSVPYYPEWNDSQYEEELPDTQLDSPQPSPVKIEPKKESPHVPPQPKPEVSQPPSSGSGDDDLKQAKKDLLLAQLRLARWADKNTFKVCSPKQALHVLSTKHVIAKILQQTPVLNEVSAHESSQVIVTAFRSL